jgi:hypothetical protein
MYLFMTKAFAFGDTVKSRLGQKGFAAASDDRGRPIRKIELVKKGKPEIHLKIRVVATDEKHDWWSPDHDGTTGGLADAMRDPEAQVVMFRGHAGDYAFEPISRVRASGKLFIDLSCYSDFRSQSSIRHCEGCSYFGTTGTTNGPNNDAVMSVLIDDLPRRLPAEKLLERFKQAVPAGKYYMTGTGSAAAEWERAVGGAHAH